LSAVFNGTTSYLELTGDGEGLATAPIGISKSPLLFGCAYKPSSLAGNAGIMVLTRTGADIDRLEIIRSGATLQIVDYSQSTLVVVNCGTLTVDTWQWVWFWRLNKASRRGGIDAVSVADTTDVGAFPTSMDKMLLGCREIVSQGGRFQFGAGKQAHPFIYYGSSVLTEFEAMLAAGANPKSVDSLFAYHTLESDATSALTGGSPLTGTATFDSGDQQAVDDWPPSGGSGVNTTSFEGGVGV
jgi:hypothetical protein